MNKVVDVDKYYNELVKEEEYLKHKKKQGALKYLATHQEVRLLHSSKQRAKASGLEHALTVSDIKIPERCPYLDIPITNRYQQGRVWSNASIDRIDNSKGYTPDNIQVISDLANRMKQDATPEQLLAFAKGVFRLHGGTQPS